MHIYSRLDAGNCSRDAQRRTLCLPLHVVHRVETARVLPAVGGVGLVLVSYRILPPEHRHHCLKPVGQRHPAPVVRRLDPFAASDQEVWGQLPVKNTQPIKAQTLFRVSWLYHWLDCDTFGVHLLYRKVQMIRRIRLGLIKHCGALTDLRKCN